MKQVGVVGTGRMGSDMATLLAAYGFHVTILGISEGECEKGRNNIEENLNELSNNNIIDNSTAQRCMQLIAFTQDYRSLADLDFVFEAVVERIDIKHSVYLQLEAVCSERTIIISITSGITAYKLAESIVHKERLIVAHAWNPPHLIPLVEVVGSEHTAPDTVKRTLELLETLDRKVVVLKRDIPGFIGNRIMHAMYREALYLVEIGVASPAEIDLTVLYSFGQRFASVGLLEYYDSCDLNLQFDVQSYLLAELCDAKGPQKPLVDCCLRGDYGPKTGNGIYDWSKKDLDEFRLRKNKPFFQYVTWRRGDYGGNEQ